jgi:CheY-like chemotaxis protein/MinD-like ATPase involved in chromosome partitioning or flagellar assembly
MPEKILIIDDDLDTLRLVGLMLQKQGYQIIAASSGPQGLELAFSELPDLILLDVMMPGMDGYEVARNLRGNERTVNTPILMFTAKSQLDDKVTGFEAGADDYLTKPTHPSELQAHVKALLARSSKNKINPPTGPVAEKPAYIIGVLAARGGLGVTSVAANLAASLLKKTAAGVVLAEFRPGHGTLFFDLNLAQASGLTELLNTPALEIKRSLVAGKLIKHSSGVEILPASFQPKDAVLLNNIQQFEIILNRLQFMTRYVVVDLGNGLDILNQKLASVCNELLVVVEPFESSLQHSRALLDDLINLDIDKNRLHVVVNYRIRSDTQLSVPQVQDRIKSAIDITFTPAPELLQQAARMQTMASLVHEDGLTTQQYNLLATKIEARAPKPA